MEIPFGSDYINSHFWLIFCLNRNVSLTGVMLQYLELLYHLYSRRSLRAWKSEYLRVTSDLNSSDFTRYSTCLRISPFFSGAGSMLMESRTKESMPRLADMAASSAVAVSGNCCFSVQELLHQTTIDKIVFIQCRAFPVYLSTIRIQIFCEKIYQFFLNCNYNFSV